jgi:plasmid stabilization system protein ParE
VKVIWSPLAIQRVLETSDFIALDKPDAAIRWAESVFRAVERLELHPESGRIVPELGRAEVREIVHGSYRVIYRVGDDRVLILTVRGSRQQFDPAEID